MSNLMLREALYCCFSFAVMAGQTLAHAQAPDPCLVQPAADPPEPGEAASAPVNEQTASQFSAPATKATDLAPTAPLQPPQPVSPQQPPRPPIASPAPLSASGIRVVINASTHTDALQGLSVVEGAPYCADAVSEYVKTLADGNRITKLSNTRLCRDEKGRTRQEVGSGASRRIFINDPVAKASWVLNSNAKTFSRVGANSRLDSRGDSGSSPASASTFAGNGLTNGVFNGVVSTGTARVHYVSTSQASEQASIAADARQRVLEWARDFSDRVRSGRSSIDAHAQPQLNAITVSQDVLTSLATQSNGERGPGVVSALSTRDIDGVRANGQLTTWTIAAGKVGNEKPIRITREVWTSPELMLTVLSKDIDPRDGENNYRLSNVVRSPPDPELFKVPAEFSEGKR